MGGPAKGSKKKTFGCSHHIGNRQHDDVQNEKSLGANLSQLYEKEGLNGVNR